MNKKIFFTILLNFFYLLSYTQNFNSQTIISDNVYGAKLVLSSDINNDGNLDILALGKNKVYLFINEGNGLFKDGKIIFELDLPKSLITADIDDDGDLDIIIGGGWSENYITWYSNDGSGNFGNPNVLSTNINTVGSIASIDVDGDDKIDIIATAYHGGELVWFKNYGIGNFSTKRIIGANLEGAKSVFVGDFNNNSNSDILMTTYNDSKIILFTNNGNGNFTKRIINTIDGYLNFVFGSDLNNDGLLDIISNSSKGYIAWYKNEGNNTFTEKLVGNDFNIGSVGCSDLDGDGNIDISVATYTLNGSISVYMNNGEGFSEKKDISTDVVAAYCVYNADIDNDGDTDILSASVNDKKIALYRNKLISDIEKLHSPELFEISPNPVKNHICIDSKNKVFNKLKILNILGEIEYESSNVSGYHNLSGLKTGTYILNLINKHSSQSILFFKQ